MRYLSIILFLVLLSSCNLFRKINKEKDYSKGQSESTQKSESSSEEIVKQESNTNINTKKESESESDIKVYPTPGTNVTVNADGSVTGQLDSVKTKRKDKGKEDKNETNQTTSSATTITGTTDETKDKNLIITKGESTNSTTDWKLYVILPVVLFIIFLVWRKVK